MAKKCKNDPPRLHKNVIPGLDALIGDWTILEPTAETKRKAELLVIPTHYADRCRRFRDELSNRGEAASKIIDSFAHMLESIHTSNSNEFVCANGMRITFQKELKEGEAKSTAAITVLAAKWFIENSEYEDREDTAILTGDNFLVAEASLNNIDVAHVNPEVYTGRRKLTLTDETMNAWCKYGHITQEMFARNFPDEPPLYPNEFVHFSPCEDLETENKDFIYYIGRFERTPIQNEFGETIQGWAVRRLHYISDMPKFIKPRTPGQAMLAEALLAPADEIPIVICPSPFGTGKTFLATAIGAQKTIFDKKPSYDSIFVCPRDSELGREIGYLPGDETAKTVAKARPIIDNLESYLNLRGDNNKGGERKSRAQVKKDIEHYLQDFFEFVSVINMGGRSLERRWIIFDEAQELERFQINQLMKREGDYSKLIITGDPEQVYNRHLNKQSNGLSYAATKMRGSEYVIVVSMLKSEITRSKAAREIAERLG